MKEKKDKTFKTQRLDYYKMNNSYSSTRLFGIQIQNKIRDLQWYGKQKKEIRELKGE